MAFHLPIPVQYGLHRHGPMRLRAMRVYSPRLLAISILLSSGISILAFIDIHRAEGLSNSKRKKPD